MGCGSSARGRSAAKVSPANTITVFDGPALEAQAERRDREREDDEVRWLRMLIEKEKAEKEWLMSRYEHTEKDLQARNEECARLRLQLTDARDRAPVEKTLPANGTRTSESSAPVSPNRSPVPNLKERRGLKLSVETNSRVTSKPAENVANAGSQLADSASKLVLQASPSQKSLEQSREAGKQDAGQNLTQASSTRTKEFLASLNQERSGELVEPMTAMACVGSRGSWGRAHNEEPMSPLLRRRREAPRTSLRDKFKSTPGDMGTGLSVMTPKVFQMDDVPQTPKRVPATPATARRRQETMWSTIVEDVVEDDDK